MSLIVEFFTIFHTELVDTLIIYLHSKFRMHNIRGLLVTTTKPKDKYIVHSRSHVLVAHATKLQTKTACFSETVVSTY
jgi:hypothetical protein